MPSDTATEPQVTTASAWKGAAVEGIVTELPSGNVVRIKRTMDILHLLKAGKIPNPLASVVQKMLNKGQQQPGMEDMNEGTIAQMLDLVDKTCVKSVVEPVMVLPPEPGKDEDGKPIDLPEGEDEESPEAYQLRVNEWETTKLAEGVVPLTKVELDDRMFIFVFSQGFAADLESFRAEQAASMASLADGEAPAPKAKPARKRK